MIGQLVDRKRYGSGNMPGAIFRTGTYVHHDDLAALEPLQKLGPSHRFEPVPRLKEVPGDLLDLGQPLAGEGSQAEEKLANTVVCDAVEDLRPLLTWLDEPRGPERLQVGGRVSDPHARGAGQRFDGALGLAEQV